MKFSWFLGSEQAASRGAKRWRNSADLVATGESVVRGFLKSGLVAVGFCAGMYAQGLPPRATPADYQVQGKAGTVTIAAEFTGHAVPTAEGPLTNEENVAVEVALFGAPGEKTKISVEDFSLRINGKKSPLPVQPYALVFKSLKDPEWQPPTPPAKSKTSIGGSGGEQDSGPPPPVKIPIEVQRAMQAKVQKAALPEGDRTLPQAGVLFFQYRGKSEGIHEVELIYSGPAGKATLTLQ